MKKMRNFVFAGCVVLLLSQCASQEEVRKLNYQIRTVNQKVEEIKSSTVNQMQKRQASSVNKLDAVSDETLQLRTLISENEQKERQYQEQNKENFASLHTAVEQLRAENEQRIKTLELRIDQLADSLERMQQARVQTAEKRARDAAKKAEQARQRTVNAASVASGVELVTLRPAGKKVRITGKTTAARAGRTSKPRVAANEKKVIKAAPAAPVQVSDPFSRGMSDFKAGKYKEAYTTFEQVLASNPKGAKAAQTLFYMGECLYNQGEYDLAILDYQKVISNHARDSHTPAALLKQGMSFEKLTDLETAKIIYKKLIADYPNSSEAGLAGKKLAKL